MTKQEAIEYGLRWKNAICDRGDTEWSEAIQFLNAAIEALHEEREWIPVSERLPKQQEKIYWICTDCGYQCECRWTNVNHFWTWLTTDWHWHFADVPQYQKVVAWMPLPEPYKESDEQ